MKSGLSVESSFIALKTNQSQEKAFDGTSVGEHVLDLARKACADVWARHRIFGVADYALRKNRRKAVHSKFRRLQSPAFYRRLKKESWQGNSAVLNVALYMSRVSS